MEQKIQNNKLGKMQLKTQLHYSLTLMLMKI